MTDAATILQQLMGVIEERRRQPSEKSYTTSLLKGGVARIGSKIIEEAGEIVEAAGETGDGGRRQVVHEAADLIYHLFVLLAHQQIPLAEVEAELARRFGVSGLAEKAARSPTPHRE